MLNLSDKELDHFAKEAAQEYDPGDVLGERSWEGLEIRLDRDLGKVHLNPLRHIRRFPFYYAPAMLVLLGVSYYLIRQPAGPPGRMAKPNVAVVQNSSSSQRPEYKKTTTLDSSAATPTLRAEQARGKAVGGGEVAAAGAAGANGAAGSNGAAGAGGSTARAAGSAVGSAGPTGTTGPAGPTSGPNATTESARVAAAAGRHGATAPMAGTGSTTASGSMRAPGAANAVTHVQGRKHRGKNAQASQRDNRLAITAPLNAGLATNGKDAEMVAGSAKGGSTGHTQVSARGELAKVALQGLRPMKKAPYISDSALRAFTLKSKATQLIRKGGMHINRSLEIGLLAAPDFASVNSLAGDRPGSTIGLTVDYQFANHWYVGSGLLLDRKIFSAYGQDFHEPAGFYAANGVQGAVYLVKGSFEMLEIPLNLRYDFTVSGSTSFFVSSGLSSYLLTSQNNNYYYRSLWNPGNNECQPVASPDKSYLCSALNLSLGVETGLSNSLSLLIAPYMKIPVHGVGIGQVQMSTVGINFALKFAPVISRKRY